MPCQLIINADDLGYDPAVTKGIVRAMREGVVTSTTFMVNTPHSEDAAREAQGLSVGLHLNLARHPPLSKVPAALLRDGAFDEPRAGELPPEVVRAEALAQLARLQEWLGVEATHVDVHKHLHQHPGVLEGLAAAAREAKLPVRSIDAPMRQFLRSRGVATNDHFIGDAGKKAHWTLEQLERDLAQLPADGIVELMCHPGYAPTHTKSGYAHQREVELQTFIHPRARELLQRAGVALVDFRAVR